jgi:hypothetical protein
MGNCAVRRWVLPQVSRDDAAEAKVYTLQGPLVRNRHGVPIGSDYWKRMAYHWQETAMTQFRLPSAHFWLFGMLGVLVVGLGLPVADAYYSNGAQLSAHTAFLPCAGNSCASAHEDQLRWPPPCLESPNVIQVEPDDSTTLLRLENEQDYIIEMPDVPITRGLAIRGGRNIVMIGGEIAIPWQGDYASIESRTGLQILQSTGTVHIEGLLLHGDDISEGIQIAAPSATVQLENVGIFGIHARDEVGFSDNHPDLIQTYGGVNELRVDKLTGSSDYQGLFFKAEGRAMGSVYLSRVNVIGLPTARYLIWFEPYLGSGNVFLWGVWVNEPATSTEGFSHAVWPDPNGKYPTQARVSTTFSGKQIASWPSAMKPQVNGLVMEGSPPDGNFVNPNDVGVGYRSPGYQEYMVCNP